MARLLTTTCPSCGGPARLPPETELSVCAWCGVLLVDPLHAGRRRERGLRLAVDNVGARLDGLTSEARRGLATGSTARARKALMKRTERLLRLAEEEGVVLAPLANTARWKDAVVARELAALSSSWSPPAHLMDKLWRAIERSDPDLVDGAWRSLADAWRLSDPNWSRASRKQWEELVDRGLRVILARLPGDPMADPGASRRTVEAAEAWAWGEPEEAPRAAPSPVSSLEPTWAPAPEEAPPPEPRVAALPELPVPELPVPELPVPELPVPELPVPELPVPELPVPEPPVSPEPAGSARSEPPMSPRPEPRAPRSPPVAPLRELAPAVRAAPDPVRVAIASLLLPGLGQAMLGDAQRGLRILLVALVTLGGCGLVSLWAAWDAWSAARRALEEQGDLPSR